jgi:hypothetical protein
MLYIKQDRLVYLSLCLRGIVSAKFKLMNLPNCKLMNLHKNGSGVPYRRSYPIVAIHWAHSPIPHVLTRLGLGT